MWVKKEICQKERFFFLKLPFFMPSKANAIIPELIKQNSTSRLIPSFQYPGIWLFKSNSVDLTKKFPSIESISAIPNNIVAITVVKNIRIISFDEIFIIKNTVPAIITIIPCCLEKNVKVANTPAKIQGSTA
jgi:hypothetical protein